MYLCKVCNDLDLEEFDTRLGEYNELITKSENGCEGCKFFCKILQSSTRWKDRLPDVSGQILFFYMKGIDVRKPDKVNSKGSCAPDLKFDICTSEDYSGPKNPEVDSRRIIPVNPLDDKCFAQIHTWMSECSDHNICSRPGVVGLPKRIIEIPRDNSLPPRLCLSNGKKGSYVVLSHCTGDAEFPKLMSSNLARFQESIDTSALPKTFSDAITITRRLGAQYLWVGALCILQDDKEDWIEESSKFALIYGQASIMISADAAEDANKGILADRHVHYSPALGKAKDQYLRLHLLSLKTDIECAPLARRSWAALERILAPRIVHYTKRQMIWECATSWCFEASGIEDKLYGSGQIRQNYQKKIVQPYINKALTTPGEKFQDKIEESLSISKQVSRLEAWHQCVDEFAGRSLTVPSDKLPVMANIASIIDNGTMGDFLAGIWSQHIAFGLGWSRIYSLLTPAPEYRAPSWSWASVDGPTGSIFLTYPETLLQDQANDPTWINKYGPKLISHHMIPLDPTNLYMGVLEGSHLVLNGSCVGLKKLCDHLDDNDTLDITLVLDQSPIFDCPCCGPRSAEVQETESEKFTQVLDHHICMVLQGDAWHQTDSNVDMLVLRAVGGQEETFERVGLLKLSHWSFHAFDAEKVHGVFDGIGWERREVKLI